MFSAEAAKPREFDDLAKLLVRGELTYPDDAAYPTAIKTWNAQVLQRPKVVVRARGAGDVIAAVKYAAKKDLPLAVKSGGHSMMCLSDGLLIDLSLMKSVRVDLSSKVARVEAGCLLGDLDAELASFGLVVPAGVVSHTGVAGLALGGGVGYLGRHYGLTCDHIVSVDIVTADGQLRVASQTQNEDLFWAVRGAGASFGVVTSFEFRCQEMSGPVFGGPTVFPLPRLEEVGKKFVEVTSSPETFPNEAYFTFVLSYGPTGHPGVVLSTVYSGSDLDKGAQVLKPFTDLGPVMQQVGPVPFKVVQKSIDHLVPHGRSYYQTGIFVENLSEEIVTVLGKQFHSMPTTTCMMMIETEGGKIAEFSDDECAVSWRKAKFCVNVVAAWDKAEDEEKCKAWVRTVRDELKPFKYDSTYINLFDVSQEELGKIPVSEYFGSNTNKLRELKKKWDPANLFRSQADLFKAD